MTDIPEDVMRAASALAKAILDDITSRRGWRQAYDNFDAHVRLEVYKTHRNIFADAIMAERERCANIADRWATDEQRRYGNGGPAAAIRKGADHVAHPGSTISARQAE